MKEQGENDLKDQIDQVSDQLKKDYEKMDKKITDFKEK